LDAERCWLLVGKLDTEATVQAEFTALEECVDRKLVEHLRTGYRLTELGKRLFPYAEDIERCIAALQRQLMSEGQKLKSTLPVTRPEVMASRLLAPLIDPIPPLVS
jgi:DNA-binding transcriptional LysR family regulator